MSISLFRSDRIELLVEKLADLIRNHSSKNVFIPTEILISSDGMKHFINLSISRYLGVAHNIRYSKVHAFFWRILYETQKNQKQNFRYCYAPEILQWQILNLFQSDTMPKTVKQALNDYLKSHNNAQYELSEIMAKLFEQYMIYRPNLIREWSENKLINNLGKDEIWQKDLWLAIRQKMNTKNRVELLDDLLDKLQNKPFPFRLPEKVFVFAAGALAPLYLQLFSALSSHIDIHLLVLSPSSAYWGDARKNDSDANPLLASLGGQSRDFFDLLNEINFYADEEYFTENEITSNTSLLHRIQYAIRHYQPLENIEKTQADHSIVLHSAYSPLRELHAVKDAILYFLQENQQYTTDDVAVLSPNIETYAPFIDAVFGANAADGITLPFSLADTAIGVGSAYIGAWEALLAVFDSRFEVEVVWTLIENQIVLQCADLNLSDLSLIRQVLQECNICFAWDGAERQKYGGRENEDLFSWQPALNRIRAAFRLPENTVEPNIPPLSIDIEQLPAFNHFLKLIEKIQHFRKQWQQTTTVSDWVTYLHQIHHELLNDDSEDAHHFLQAINNWQEQCEIAQLTAPLPNSVIASHLRHLFSTPTQKNFLRGGISFGSLIPLRTLPFAFLCLLGLDANSFPRPSVSLPFDLMKTCPQKGDRSRRDDDRYLFLENIISARHTLYLSYVGKDIHSNSTLAPSELIWELGDTLTVLSNSKTEYWQQHTIQHPLQPFSPKYFLPDESLSGSLKKSFRQKYADALNQMNIKNNEQNQPINFIEHHFTTPDWQTFVDFWKNPARQWLKQHTNWEMPYIQKRFQSNEPFEINHKQHGTDILINLVEHGDNATARLTAQNYFPAAFLGDNARQLYQTFAEEIKKENQTLGETIDFHTEHFSGSLNNIDLAHHQRIILDGTMYEEIHPNILISLWLEHLIANTQWENITTNIYRPAANQKAFLLPIPKTQAEQYLNDWLEIYQQGQNEPIYFFPKSGWSSIKAMFSKGADEKRKQLSKCVTHHQSLSLPELQDFLYKIITKAHSEWLGDTKYKRGENEDYAYQVLFHERNTQYTPLSENAPKTPINTAEFIQLCVKLLLPIKQFFQVA